MNGLQLQVKLDTKTLCFFCLRECHISNNDLDTDPDSITEKENEYNNRKASLQFSKLMFRYLGFEHGLQLKLCIECCLLTNMISEAFQQYEIAEMKLFWRIESLCNIIKHSDGVPQRRTEFREKVSPSMRQATRAMRASVFLKCMKKLACMKPRVSVSKLDSNREKRVGQFSSHPQDNLLMLSLIGCVLSFWIVISLSAIDPEETIRFVKSTTSQKNNISISTNTEDIGNIFSEEVPKCPIQIVSIQTLASSEEQEEDSEISSHTPMPWLSPLSLEDTAKSNESLEVADEQSSPENARLLMLPPKNHEVCSNESEPAPGLEPVSNFSLNESTTSLPMVENNPQTIEHLHQEDAPVLNTVATPIQPDNPEIISPEDPKPADPPPKPAKKRKILMLKEVMDDAISKFVIQKKVKRIKQENLADNALGKRLRRDSEGSQSTGIESGTPVHPQMKEASSLPPDMRPENTTNGQWTCLERIKLDPASPLAPTELVDSDASTEVDSICSEQSLLEDLDVPPSPSQTPELLEGLGMEIPETIETHANGNTLGRRVDREDLKYLIDEYFIFGPKGKRMKPVSPKPLPISSSCAYLICETCEMRFDTRAKLEKHRVVSHNLKKYVKCQLCSEMFDCYADLENHRSLNIACEVLEETKELELSDMAKPIFPFRERDFITGNKFCPFEHCYEVFSSARLLYIHMKTHGNFGCHFCSKLFEKASDLALHEYMNHATPVGINRSKKKGDFACPRCQFYGKKDNEYINHFIQNHLNITDETVENDNNVSCAFNIIKY